MASYFRIYLKRHDSTTAKIIINCKFHIVKIQQQQKHTHTVILENRKLGKPKHAEMWSPDRNIADLIFQFIKI